MSEKSDRCVVCGDVASHYPVMIWDGTEPMFCCSCYDCGEAATTCETREATS
jgi:hypothetical protein